MAPTPTGFQPEDTIKLQFRCERPGGDGIEVSQLVTAADLGLTGNGGEQAVALTAQFDSDAIADALSRASAPGVSVAERLQALAEAQRLEAEYRTAIASQLEDGAQSQGESVAQAVVDYLVGGNLRDAKGNAISFSRDDGSAYVIKESELNVTQRVEVAGNGFFMVTATATWG